MGLGDLVIWYTKYHVKQVEITGIILKERSNTVWIKPLLLNEAGEEYVKSLSGVANMDKIPIHKTQCTLLV